MKVTDDAWEHLKRRVYFNNMKSNLWDISCIQGPPQSGQTWGA